MRPYVISSKKTDPAHQTFVSKFTSLYDKTEKNVFTVKLKTLKSLCITKGILKSLKKAKAI